MNRCATCFTGDLRPMPVELLDFWQAEKRRLIAEAAELRRTIRNLTAQRDTAVRDE